jgi:hypothetical protein
MTNYLWLSLLEITHDHVFQLSFCVYKIMQNDFKLIIIHAFRNSLIAVVEQHQSHNNHSKPFKMAFLS